MRGGEAGRTSERKRWAKTSEFEPEARGTRESLNPERRVAKPVDMRGLEGSTDKAGTGARVEVWRDSNYAGFAEWAASAVRAGTGMCRTFTPFFFPPHRSSVH